MAILKNNIVKKIFSILFITFIHLISQAQIATIYVEEFLDSSKTRIGISADYDLNSNAFTNAFISKFYKGGYIDTDLKNSVLKRAKNTNRIGGNFNYGINGVINLDSLNHKKNISVFFSVRDRMHVDAQFSKDLYRVGFYGNSQHAGETANFNDFNLNLIRYQQIQIGLFSSKLDSAARWGIGLSFLKGEQYLSIAAKKAELFTSEDGQYIDFTTEMNVAQSDTARKGFGAFNGFGSSVDMFFEAPFQTRFGVSKLRVSVSDIGFIHFNKQTLNFTQDSTFHYTGFKIGSFSDLQDSTMGATSTDSIINSIAPSKKQSYSATLPTILDLNFETHFATYFHLKEGIRYVFNGNNKLLFYVTGKFYFNPKFMLSATFGYGGYGILNYGLGINAKLGNGFVIYAGSNNIEGYLAPKKTSGQGVYISLIKQF